MLQTLYLILSTIYMYTVILLLSVVLNSFYRLKYWKQWHSAKQELLELSKEVSTVPEAVKMLTVVIPEYGNDFFGGALNWFATPLVTYCRTKYDPTKIHSKNCKEHASVLQFIIRNSKLKDRFYKTEVISFLSYKPFIRYNHAILIAYDKKNGQHYITVFTPFKYCRTIPLSEKKNIYKLVEKVFKKVGVKYMRKYIKNYF